MQQSFARIFSKRLLIDIVKIIICATLCAVIMFATQDRHTAKSIFAKPIKSIPAKPVVVQSVDLATAIKLHLSPKAIFLDVRSKKFYDYGHISGAINFDPGDGIDFSEQQLDSFKSARAVVIYCNGLQCGTSYVIAQKLIGHGLKNVKVYNEGWPEWKACRLPMDMSEIMKKDIAGM